MSDITGARWYVVQTQVNGEAKAAENLRRQGYETYLPRYLKRRRHARKVDFTREALVSALHVRGHRHGDAALAFGTVDVRRFAPRHQRR